MRGVQRAGAVTGLALDVLAALRRRDVAGAAGLLIPHHVAADTGRVVLPVALLEAFEGVRVRGGLPEVERLLMTVGTSRVT